MQLLLPQIKISGFFLQKWQVKRVVNRSTAILSERQIGRLPNGAFVTGIWHFVTLFLFLIL